MLGDRPRAQSLPPYLLFALGADWQAKTVFDFVKSPSRGCSLQIALRS